jgi:hypothetical protein
MMKTQLWLPLCACSVLAITGCSGGAQLAPATPPNVSGAARELGPHGLGEVLTANKVTVKNQLCLSKGSSVVTTFKASGTAKGPYAGTFTAKGTWNITKLPGNDLWTFSQTYVIKTSAGEVDGTITGNGQKIKATCKTFGPATGKADLTFKLVQHTGSATTSVIRSGALDEHLN